MKNNHFETIIICLTIIITTIGITSCSIQMNSDTPTDTYRSCLNHCPDYTITKDKYDVNESCIKECNNLIIKE